LEQRCFVVIPQCNIRGFTSTSLKNASTGAYRSTPHPENSANIFNDNVVQMMDMTGTRAKNDLNPQTQSYPPLITTCRRGAERPSAGLDDAGTLPWRAERR
jgi:hypothetical protein